MKNWIIDRKYNAMKRLGQYFKIPIPEYFVELEVYDKDGNLIRRHKQRALSLTRNYYNCLLMIFAAVNSNNSSSFGAGHLNVKNVGGTVVKTANTMCLIFGLSLFANNDGSGFHGGSSDDTYGIVVGTGTDAESFEDYALAAQVANGTGAGQMSYVESEDVAAPSWSSPIFTVTHIRYFNNNSGGSIGINEIGLRTEGNFQGAADTSPDMLLHRDKLTSQVDVPNTGQLKVTYTIILTYPS